MTRSFIISLLILAILAPGCSRLAPPPPETAYRRFVSDFDSALLSDVQWIDFGAEKSLPYLMDGWGAPVSTPDGKTFAYAVGLESGLRFWVNRPVNLRAAFGAQEFVYPGAPGQIVEALVNGRRVGNFSLGADFGAPVVAIPADVLKVGENTLTLKFAWTKSPAEVDPASLDRRKLAAYFDYAIVYQSEEAARRFMQTGVSVTPGSKGAAINVPTIQMPEGSGLRFHNVPITRDARLKFGISSSGGAPDDRALMDVLFKPDGEDIITLFSRQVKAGQAQPQNIDLDLSKIGPKRGVLIFHVLPADKIGDANFYWVDPRLVSRRPNVLLIVADALRADRLKSYGGPVEAPNLEALARDGALFERAFSHYPATPPSFSTIFTGKIPPHHGVRTLSDPLSTGEYTLAEALTGLLDSRGGFAALNILPTNMGFGQGFTRYELTQFKGWRRDAEEVNAEVLPWIRDHARDGFFAFIHYADTHAPYAAPGSFEATIKGFIDDRPAFERRIDRPDTLEFPLVAPPGDHNLVIKAQFPDNCTLPESGPSPLALTSIEGDIYSFVDARGRNELESDQQLTPAKPFTVAIHNPGKTDVNSSIRFFVNPLGGGRNGCPGGDQLVAYDREVAYLDGRLGRLIALLKELGVYDQTAIVFTADHGEAFAEHGVTGHIDGLYDEFLRVPLIMRAPWIIPRASRISEQVGLMSVTPTILDICGLPRIPDADGASLIDSVRGKKSLIPLFSETVMSGNNAHFLAVRTPEWKLIRSEDGKKVELYNLINDPGEKHNLAASRPDEVRILTELLNKMLKGKASVAHKEVPEEVKARLRAMGYIK